MNWFDTARFGMFIHWGHISQQGIDEYATIIAVDFSPA